MSPSSVLLAVLFGSDGELVDLATLPGVLKLTGLIAGVLGPVTVATWTVAARTYRARVRAAERQAAMWKSQAECSGEQADKYRGEANAARAALAPFQAELAETRNAQHAAEKDLQAARHELEAARTGLDREQKELDRLRGELDHLQHTVGVLRTEAGVTEEQLDDRTKALTQLERRVKAALKLEGQLWNAKALQKRPKFREIGRRQCAIVSVLNLKGGVGKTTVTAHLGAAFARRGYRVLLLDLDLQGSLTSLLLTQDKINALVDDTSLMQHFLSAAADDRRVKLADYVQEVFTATEAGGALHLVGTTDKLGYAELNLTMRWLMGSGDRDTRFLLRKALHLMSVSREYDLVLVDCPPLVNISCVNALAASDYLLVPTTLSRRSAERVPPMLRRVVRDERFVRFINPKLQVLGLVANRTYPAGMTSAERDDWDQLAGWCRDAYGQEVTRFATTIPDIRDVRHSETEFTAHPTGTRLETLFGQLAADVEKELPSECRRSAKAPS